MKVLMLCNKSPYPAKEGGPIAMNMMVEGLLEQHHTVKVLAFNTNKYGVNSNDLPKDYREATDFETVYADLRIKPIDAFINLFSNKSYHVQRFISKAVHQKLRQILEASPYDIVQLETLFMAPYISTIRKYSNARIVLRAHNIEHRIWERIKNSCNNPFKRWYLNHLSQTLKAFELNTINTVDGIAAITHHDAAYFKQHTVKPVISIPFGIDIHQFYAPKQNTPQSTLFHLGSMNWMPNEEGIRWFLNNVWPEVHIQHPDLILRLAGREMPEWLIKTTYSGVEIIGEVENAAQFIQDNGIMVVPLLSGSGIRIKIIEGMSLSKPIITTTIGAEGIHYTHQQDIWIADSPQEFIDGISSLIKAPTLCSSIGNNAHDLIKKEHNRFDLIKKLTNFYQTI